MTQHISNDQNIEVSEAGAAFENIVDGLNLTDDQTPEAGQKIFIVDDNLSSTTIHSSVLNYDPSNHTIVPDAKTL